MDKAKNYQVIFTGQLRKGHEAAAVKQALVQRLKLSPAQVERLFSNGQTVLKTTPSEEQARRIVTQLAAVGAVARVVSGSDDKAATASGKKNSTAANKASAGTAELPRYKPLRKNFLLKPLLYSVAGIELLLGVVYLALVGGLLFGVIFPSLFTTWAGDLFESPLLGLPLQMITFLLGALALLIVLKPLLALRASRHRGIVISPEQEPDLYAFIEDVCERIEAPVPSEIRLYNEASVRTAYYRGPLGFFRNEPVLTIGVALIAGLNASQLAGLIALSLNRYRRPNAPRATAILLTINSWLQRAVSEDDPIEAIVRRWHKEGRLGKGLFRLIERFFDAGRQLVRWRMALSRRLGRRLIHRFVAEGDKMALALCGSEGFIRLLDQTSLLDFTGQNVLPKLSEQWKSKGELPGNLVQMMVLRARQYPADTPQKLRAIQTRQKALIGDVLPSDTQRLKRVAHQPIMATYFCLSPAVVLFRNYTKLTHTMTLRFYHHRLQLPVSPYNLRQIAPKGSMEHQLQQHLDHYFLHLYADFLPLKLRQRMRGINSVAEAQKQWQVAMARLRSGHERARMTRQRYDESEAELVATTGREEMQLAGIGQLWQQETLKGSELEALHQRARDAESEHEQAAHSLEQYLKAHATRLGTALAVLDQNEQLPQELASLKDEARLLVSVLERIDNIHDQLRELWLNAILLETLLSYQPLKKRPKLNDRIEQRAADVKHLVTAIGVALKSASYPFASGGSMPLMKYVLQEAATDETPRGDFDRGNDTVKRLTLVQRRAIVRLVDIAMQVEKALGLAP